jgi:fatty acid-binding protein DegV
MQALFGSLLSVKPILEVKEGKIEAIERVRTREKAIARLKELIESRLAPGSRVRMSVFHSNEPERARVFGEWAQERYHCTEFWVSEVGATVAAHGGPGIVGACFVAAD